LSVWLLRREFAKRLVPPEITPARAGPEPAAPSARASA
jgi:hypothetical protein